MKKNKAGQGIVSENTARNRVVRIFTENMTFKKISGVRK